MTVTTDRLDRVVALLGGWPDHFEDMEREHGQSLLSVLMRDRTIDEVVFGLVCRYALHRAAFDRLSAEIKDELAKPLTEPDSKGEAETGHYLSGKHQTRAYHENKLLTLEKELLATPYARVKSLGKAQTSFLDQLEETPPDGGGSEDRATASRKVTPFRPLAKKA